MDLWGLIVFAVVGLIAGFIARALVPGPDPMGWLGTMVLGIVGSFVGGTLAALIFGGTLALSAAGLIGSVIGAIIVLLIWRAMGGRRGVVA
jgi:uncharacterized membrane protein YeaQ/YmgE (transglycosylase-associated protein family)